MTPTALDNDFAAESIPACFGRYRVVRELGRGGMARVFEGQHSELGRRVALKVMQPALAAHPHAATRFLREAKAASHIRHQNIVEVFDIGMENGLPFLVMEFLEGSNLAALLDKNGPLPVHGIAEIFLPVTSAVAAAHAAGIVHRDLKPANLMITRRAPRSMHPMVLDFGISKFIDDEELDKSFTRSESLLGTVQYMAPELTRGAKFASPASDQYAIGVMLYECATGRRPFVGDGHYQLMHAIVTAPVEPPSRLRASLPREFDAIVERAMHRDPAQRFPSMKALGSALLSLGDKTAWTLWENDFIGGSEERDPWHASSTLCDGELSAQSNTKRRWHAPGHNRGGWKAWILPAYALATTIALALAQFAGKPVNDWSHRAGEAVRASPPPPAETELAKVDRPAASEPSAAAAPSSSSAVLAARGAAAPLAAKDSSGALPSRRPAKPIAAPNVAPAASTSRAVTKAVVLGTNGAPIVD
jgi:serine/threonine protein kinase